MRFRRLALAVALGVATAGCTTTGPHRGGYGGPGTPDYIDDQLDDSVSPLAPDDRYGEDQLVPGIGGPEGAE